MNEDKCPHGLQTTELVWLADEVVLQDRIISYATKSKAYILGRLVSHYGLTPVEVRKLLDERSK